MTEKLMKRPAFQFYPGDWQRDSALRSCSIAARGLWIEMLCIMHDATPYGHLKVGSKAITPERLALMVGAERSDVLAYLAELEESGVFSRRDGVIFSRRLVKDERMRGQRVAAGALGGNPKLTGGYARPGYIYCVRRDSDGALKIGASKSPAKRLHKIRQQHHGDDLEIVAELAVKNMGAAESTVHQCLADYKLQGEWFATDMDKVNDAFRLIQSAAEANEEASSNRQSLQDRFETFEVTDALRELGRGYGVNADDEAPAWKDHFRSNGYRTKTGPVRDVTATFRTWLRNAAKFGGAPKRAPVLAAVPDRVAEVQEFIRKVGDSRVIGEWPYDFPQEWFDDYLADISRPDTTRPGQRLLLDNPPTFDEWRKQGSASRATA